MKFWRTALTAVVLLFTVGLVPAQESQKTHEPDYANGLQRTLVPVEIVVKDAAGEPVVIDNLSITNAHINQIIRLEGEYSWEVPSEFNKLGGVLHGGSNSAPGLQPGEYQVNLPLGRYGAVKEKITVGKSGLHKELRAPLSRKVVKVRFVDEAGNPLAAIPHRPRFEEKEVYNTANDDVLPPPVLRLPPSRSEGRGGRGGFAYRRARGGPWPVVLLKNGWCYATVFDGGKGALKFELGEDDFGIESFELNAPFEESEYTAKVTLSKAWRELDLEKRGSVNKDDPGLVEYNKPAKPAENTDRKPYLAKLKLCPTVLAWSRYAQVLNDNYVRGLVRPDGIEFPVKVNSIEPLFLSSMPVYWPSEWNAYPSDDFAIIARRVRCDDRSVCLTADSDGKVKGVFGRVLTADGEPARFTEVSIFALDDDDLAQAMRKLEVKLESRGERPSEPEMLSHDDQKALRTAEDENDIDALEEAMDAATWRDLEQDKYRYRYARFGAWYDSHQRIDGDEDGYLIAPHFTLEKGKSYVMYLWHTSRDDLMPDARIVIRGAGEATDLGVVRLPKK